jgi:hypothetical protein
MNLIDRIKLKSLISFIISVIDRLIDLYHKAASKDKKIPETPETPKKPWRPFKRRKHNENT